MAPPPLRDWQQNGYCLPVTKRPSKTPASEPTPYVIPLNVKGDEALSFDMSANEGWAAYFSPMVERTGALVLVRIGPEDGVDGEPVIIDGKPAIRYPSDHAERAAFEVRELRVAVGPHTTGFASSLMRDIPFMRIEAAVNHPQHRRHLVRHLLPTNTIRADDTPGGFRYQMKPPVLPIPQRPLQVSDPGGYRKPDSFYEQVSDIYLWLAAISPRPAQDLAAANSTPVATVHRWIREAKARGLLLLPTHRGAGDSSIDEATDETPPDERTAADRVSPQPTDPTIELSDRERRVLAEAKAEDQIIADLRAILDEDQLTQLGQFLHVQADGEITEESIETDIWSFLRDNDIFGKLAYQKTPQYYALFQAIKAYRAMYQYANRSFDLKTGSLQPGRFDRSEFVRLFLDRAPAFDAASMKARNDYLMTAVTRNDWLWPALKEFQQPEPDVSILRRRPKRGDG